MAGRAVTERSVSSPVSSSIAVPSTSAPDGRASSNEALRVLDTFDTASMDLLNTRLLQDRIDRKYLVARRDLASLLDQLRASYRVVRAAGRPAASYDTLYFDTIDHRLYEDHRRERGRRYKVRVRHHFERELSFLEVKFQQGNGRTSKARTPRRFLDSSLDEAAQAFVDEHVTFRPFPVESLVPQVWTTFTRATLVGTALNERLTIDWDVVLRDDRVSRAFDDMVIVEVKQTRYANTTTAVRACASVHAREQAVSKYCLAVATLAPASRGFRPLIRKVEHLPV